MKEGAAEISDALLPPEDGSVTRALSDLKAKLSTWTAAVTNVQSALAAQAAKLTEMDAAQRPVPVSTFPQSDSVEDTHEDADHRENKDGSNNRDAAAAVAGPAAAPQEARDNGCQAQACTTEATPPETGDGDSTAQPLPLSEQVVRSEQTPQDPADADQALLDSLDETMAEAIRVQFRLFDGRKSIRELIDGYVEEPEEPQKSWWQRVKG